jgi:hypothetical protein
MSASFEPKSFVLGGGPASKMGQDDLPPVNIFIVDDNGEKSLVWKGFPRAPLLEASAYAEAALPEPDKSRPHDHVNELIIPKGKVLSGFLSRILDFLKQAAMSGNTQIFVKHTGRLETCIGLFEVIFFLKLKLPFNNQPRLRALLLSRLTTTAPTKGDMVKIWGLFHGRDSKVVRHMAYHFVEHDDAEQKKGNVEFGKSCMHRFASYPNLVAEIQHIRVGKEARLAREAALNLEQQASFTYVKISTGVLPTASFKGSDVAQFPSLTYNLRPTAAEGPSTTNKVPPAPKLAFPVNTKINPKPLAENNNSNEVPSTSTPSLPSKSDDQCTAGREECGHRPTSDSAIRVPG